MQTRSSFPPRGIALCIASAVAFACTDSLPDGTSVVQQSTTFALPIQWRTILLSEK